MNITRSTYDRQYEHVGLVRHGVQTGPWRVEFDAPVNKDDDGKYLVIRQGSVVSLNSSGKYIPGCAAGSTANHPVPFISMKNINDPDVMTGYQGRTMADSTYSGVGGVITAIPCTSGYEIETTEFDTTATYAPNDAVTAGAYNATPANNKLGLVVKATVKPGLTQPYLGFITKPAHKDYFNNTRIAFLTCFIPAGFTAE